MERIISYFAKVISDRLNTDLRSFSLNVDKQPVYIPDKRNQYKKVRRCIYHVDIDDANDVLVGSVLLGGKWNRVIYDEKSSSWKMQNEEVRK